MATKRISFKNIRALRESTGLTQAEFWAKYGLKPASGGRYERMNEIPVVLKTLILLNLKDIVSDNDFAVQLKLASK